MNRSLWFGPIAIASALVVAAGASTAHSQPYGRYDIHNYHKPFGKYGPTFSYPSPTKIGNVLNGRPANHNSNRRVARRPGQPAASSNVARLSDINLSVSKPSGQWEAVDPKQTGSRARYIITRQNPTIIISLAGEQSRDAQPTNSSLLDESQAKLQSLGGQIEPGERNLSAGSINGIAYAATVTEGEHSTYYAMWVAAHNGYTYKLAVYGDEHDKAMVDAAMLSFVRVMKPLEAPRVARTTTPRQSRR